MTDAELIEVLKMKAQAIMHEPSAVVTDDPNARADRLELAMRYLVCGGILAGEASFEKLKRFVDL